LVLTLSAYTTNGGPPGRYGQYRPRGESLAVSLGCDRTQLELAVLQSHPESPAKVALLWATRHQLGDLALVDLRARCDDLLANPLVVAAFPHYVSGFVQALDPVPALSPFVVEILSKAFGRLPDPVLLPWLPTLITTLKEQAAELIPVLTREAGRTFPGSLVALDGWTAPWNAPVRRPGGGPIRRERRARGAAVALLTRHPATAEATAQLLCCSGEWVAPDEGTGVTAQLITAHPGATLAVADLLRT
jgi:hypothetical protein